MAAEVKTREDFNVYDSLLEDRTVFLINELDFEMSSDLIAKLLYLDKQSSTREIKMYINSPGGNIDCFFAIYDTMQQITAPVKTICIGSACSAAAAILTSGSKGKRLVTPNSLVMIHSIQISEMAGSMAEISIQTKMLAKINKSFTELIARHSGKSLSKVIKDCESDLYLTAEEALSYGLVDKILKPKKSLPDLKK